MRWIALVSALLSLLVGSAGSARASSPPIPGVRVSSNPAGAEIFIDGISTGRSTPARASANSRTSAGKSVRVSLIHWATKQRAEVTAKLEKEGDVDLGLIVLSPTTSPHFETSRTETAFVSVETVPPGAKVFANGEPIGTSPVAKASVPAGRVRVTAGSGRTERVLEQNSLWAGDHLTLKAFIEEDRNDKTFCPQNAGGLVRLGRRLPRGANEDRWMTTGASAFVDGKPVPESGVKVSAGAHEIRVESAAPYSVRVQVGECGLLSIPAPPTIMGPGYDTTLYCPEGTGGQVRVHAGDPRRITVAGTSVTAAGAMVPAGMQPQTIDGAPRGNLRIEPCKVFDIQPLNVRKVTSATD